MKKAATAFLIFSILIACFSLSVNAFDVNCNLNFNELTSGVELTSGDDTTVGLNIYPKTNSFTVADFPDASDKSLKLVKTNPDDDYFNSAFPAAVSDTIIMDLKLYIVELNTSVCLMFREPTPTFFNIVQFAPDGTIVSNAKSLEEGEEPNVIGEWKPNEWIKVVAKANPSTKKYSVYINEELLLDNADIQFPGYDSVGLVRFTISGDGDTESGNTTAYVDDVRVYTGTDEVQTDEYFGGKPFIVPVIIDEVIDENPPVDEPTSETTPPEASAPESSVAVATPTAPQTGDNTILYIAAIILAAAIFTVARKKVR